MTNNNGNLLEIKKESKEIIFRGEYSKEKYNIRFINNNNILLINGLYGNEFFKLEYQEIYDLDKLKIINGFFSLYNSINDCLNNLFENINKDTIIQRIDDILILNIRLNNNKFNEIKFELKININNNKYLLTSLFNLYQKILEKEFIYEFHLMEIMGLERDIKYLNKELENLHDENDKLKNVIEAFKLKGENSKDLNGKEENIDLEKIIVEESPEILEKYKNSINQNNMMNESGENFIKLNNKHIVMNNYGNLIIFDDKLNILLKKQISNRGFHSMTKMKFENCLLASTWGNRIFIIKLSKNHINCKIIKVLKGKFDTEPGEGNRNEGIYYAIQLSNEKIVSSDNKHLLIWKEKSFKLEKIIISSGVYCMKQLNEKCFAVAQYWKTRIDIYSINDFSVLAEIKNFTKTSNLYPYKLILINDKYYILTGYGGGEESFYLLSNTKHLILDTFSQVKGWCRTFCVLPHNSFILYYQDYDDNFSLLKFTIINEKLQLITRKKLNKTITGLSFFSTKKIVFGNEGNVTVAASFFSK